MQFINSLKLFYLKNIKRVYLPKDLIKEAVKRNTNKIAVAEKGKNFTYQEIYERGKRLANSLEKVSLKKGDKVALFMYNCREYFEIRVAAYLSGIVLCPLVPDTLLEDVIFILNDCDVKAFIYHEDLFDFKIKENTKNKLFISLEKDYDLLVVRGELKELEAVLKSNDIASINFSSGTTGRPKGVILMQESWMNSFYNYVLNSSNIAEGDIKMLHVISLATAGGTAFLPSFFLGSQNFFIDRFDEKKVADLIVNENINIIFLTPGYLNLLLDYCRYNKIKLPLKNIIVGTEMIVKEKFKEAIEYFGPIIQAGYGMVEVLPPLSLVSPKDYSNNGEINESLLISVGKPMQGVEVKIIDKQGQIGRIAVKSRTVAKGYWNNPELNKKCFKEGWFISDDFGYVDKGGYLHILGRSQDIIDRENMIFRKNIEEVLHRHSSILEAHVFLKNNRVFAFVALKKGFTIKNEKELLDFCNGELINISVESVKILPFLPKNYSGKIDRKKLLSLSET
jgi:acyl-CoA synthetase (AMP-forming)/AMP-acid ligase II